MLASAAVDHDGVRPSTGDGPDPRGRRRAGRWWGGSAARQIRSPAQVAADTAPPRAAAITVPVKRRPLSTQVIVRGTVRYGAPQPVVLATSGVKGAATKQTSSDIVTQAPVKGAKLKNGASS